jgi:hypothetical protein
VNQPLASAGAAAAAGPLDPEQLKAAYARLLERQMRIMELIGTKDADHLIHDIRNILNERELLRALTNLQD